mmetsp:Transcript_20675/g.20960  ORF Transcript_20675/g.20960 Transcript_20675/m.20960 type:complete len:200 (+) Transcript_20675:178-777(+)
MENPNGTNSIVRPLSENSALEGTDGIWKTHALPFWVKGESAREPRKVKSPRSFNTPQPPSGNIIVPQKVVQEIGEAYPSMGHEAQTMGPRWKRRLVPYRETWRKQESGLLFGGERVSGRGQSFPMWGEAPERRVSWIVCSEKQAFSRFLGTSLLRFPLGRQWNTGVEITGRSGMLCNRDCGCVTLPFVPLLDFPCVGFS